MDISQLFYSDSVQFKMCVASREHLDTGQDLIVCFIVLYKPLILCSDSTLHVSFSVRSAVPLHARNLRE